MASKSRFVGARFEPEQQRKLIVLSLRTNEPGNMSAALRWLIEHAPMPSGAEWDAGQAPTMQPDREMVSA